MKRKLVKFSQVGWAYSNTGIVWGFERTRSQAKRELERITGKPWSETRAYCEVWRAKVVPLRGKP